MALRGHKKGPRRRKRAPRGPQEGPKTAPRRLQDGPKTAPSRFQDAFKNDVMLTSLQDPPTSPQDPPRTPPGPPQDPPKTPQDDPQEGPKRAQEGLRGEASITPRCFPSPFVGRPREATEIGPRREGKERSDSDWRGTCYPLLGEVLYPPPSPAS